MLSLSDEEEAGEMRNKVLSQPVPVEANSHQERAE